MADNTMATTGDSSTMFGSFIGSMSNLSTVRQVGVLIGLAAAVALGVTVALWTREPLMRPMGDIDRQSMMTVIQFLEQQKIPYRADPDGSLHVASEHYQKVQMQLAQQGIELGGSNVDSMLAKDSGFAVSQRLEQARLLRTQEVKLARAIEQFSGIRAAQVNLAIPKDAVFMRDNEKPSASVLLNLYQQRSLDAEQVRAIVDLIAGSVPNLDPSRVTVTDQFGRLHHSGSMSRDEIQSTREFSESRKRQAELQQKVERILEPIVGGGKYTVELHVDMDFSQSEQTQKLYNGDVPALRSERTLAEQNATGAPQGVAGALSNQPPAPAIAPEVANNQGGPGTTAQGSARNEAERNYDLDTTISHTRNQIGIVRRVTASIGLDYVDGVPAAEGEAAPRVARKPEEIASIMRLVQSAIGYDAQRGDVVEIQSFPFVRVEVPEAPVEVPIWEQPWFQLLLKPLTALLIALALIFGLLRPLMSRVTTEKRVVAIPDGPIGFEGMSPDRLSLNAPVTGSMSLPPPVTTELDSVERAKAVVQADPAIVAQVVKTWMERDG